MLLYLLHSFPRTSSARIVVVSLFALLALSAGAQQIASNNQSPAMFENGSIAKDAGLPDAPSSLANVAASDDTPIQDQPHSEPTVANLPRHILADLGHIVVSPSYIRTNDLKWLLPLAGAGVAAFATDTHTMLEVVSRSTSFNNTAINVSDGLRDGFIAAPVGLFLAGHFVHDEHARESGLLAIEALADANIVAEVVKLSSYRERPLVDNAQGEFFVGKSGTNGSFISGHAVTAWSSAAVLAAEYRSPWMQAGIYSLATGVSLTRVLGQQHFPSDVLLGSATGWLIGHYVYRAHHHWHTSSH